MKILQVVSSFSPIRGGGVIAVGYQLSKALAQRGHEVTIYTTDFELDQEYINSLPGVKVYPFHIWVRLDGLLLTPGMIIEAKRKLKDFDIIHTHECRSFLNIVLHHYAQKYSIPYIVDGHGSQRRSSKLKRLIDILYGYRILKGATRVIGETEKGAAEYSQAGISQDRIVILCPPFPVEDFSHSPPHGHFKEKFNIKKKNIILFLGRIHWIKGIDFLVESFYELTQDRNDVILVIVGPDDGYKPTLEKLINKLNLSDKVLFTGFLGGEEKLSALVDADMLVQTSRYEQGTGVPFEAVLCNTPIIVSKNTGSSENVSRIDAGYLVEFGNKKELKNTMQKILDGPAEAMIKTQKAKQYIIKNLSMEKNVEKYEKVYIDCIKEKQVNWRV